MRLTTHLDLRANNATRLFWARFYRGLAATALGLALVAGAPAQTPAVGAADASRYLDTIKALTVPAMEGRGDDTKGIARAADLLQQRYKSLGLEPAGTNGYLQPFSVTTGAKLAGNNRVVVQVGAEKKELKLNEDFVPFSFSSSGEVSVPVVFAGYGASADEFHYDDYSGIDVKGKIVVLLRYEPSGFAAKSGGQGLTRYATLVTKAINARNHGAAAVVIVNGAPEGKTGSVGEDLLTSFGTVSGPEDTGIMLVQVKNAVAQEWFAAAGKTLRGVQDEINASTKPESFAFPDSVHLRLDVHIETERATVNNVLAYLPGKSDEYVIIGAHYDHLGYGHYDSLAPAQIGQIHPGADDNASGTAGVLELARLFAPLKGQLPRGILFASFAGEELGLLGSADWVKEPTRPLGKAVAMLNMDMIGRIRDEKVYIGGVGTGSTFAATLTKAESGFPFHVENSAGGYASSDHTSFVAKQIPVLFFFSGLHSDYHRPSDTWDKINAPDAVRLLDMVARVLLGIDESAQRPQFVAVVEHENPHEGVVSSGGGGGYGPYFGSIPDFGQVEKGVRFSDVQPGSPAAKAGLKGGDVLVKFGEKAITNLYDFTDALRASKVGDVVEVTVLRDGKPLKASVTLEQRR
jgi:Zn-dependent M28 family amino/carboxypeptidase